jgi:hypothetical protein
LEKTAGIRTFKALINGLMHKNRTPAIYTQYAKIVLGAITDAKLKINKCKRNFMF